jgi:FkbM family methyltransferase
MTLRDNFYKFRNGGLQLYISKILKSIFSPNMVQLNKISRIDENIKVIDRFIVGEVELFGRKLEYVDYPSYESTKNEVIDQEIYKFKTDTNQPIILDCGANIGLSLIYFKKLYPNSKIIAFEPDPKIFQTLQKNIKSFNFNDIELVNRALWSSEGEISFYSEGADGGRIDHETYGNGNLITLQTTKLSRYINDKIHFLKIDIEGAETEVLKECQDKLHFVENIFIEYHSMVNSNQTLSEILEILSNQGFRYYISNIGIKSSHPFVKKRTSLGMDNQLNIFGTKTIIS